MTLHYHQDYQCVKCDTFFLPFQTPVTLCPECGEPNLQGEEFREIIKVLVEANANHRRQYGRFTPPAYGVFSLVDHYIYYSANIFDLYVERQGSKAHLIEEVLANESPAWQEHLREMLFLLFETAERQGIFQIKPEAARAVVSDDAPDVKATQPETPVTPPEMRAAPPEAPASQTGALPDPKTPRRGKPGS